MSFDARAAKLLQPGESITLLDHPGLRLEASKSGRSWIYRFKSPVDGRMKQVKVGVWPAMGYAKAALEWENLRQRRANGEDVAETKRSARALKRVKAGEDDPPEVARPYTVGDVCDDYWSGHIKPNRAPKGAREVRRLFDRELGALADVPAHEVTRAQAFELIQKKAASAPVVALYLRMELGAAWEYAIDSGKLPEETPNWWRTVLRGKVRSKGKRIVGERVGTGKRVLSPAEVATLMRWLPNLTQLIQDLVTLYLWTACRGAEIVQMEGREIVKEETGWWWVLPKDKTKNARHDGATDLRVPLFGRARSIVLRRKERYGDGYLFPSRGGALPHVEQKVVGVAIWVAQPACTLRPEYVRPRLPVTNWAPHDLRRTSRTVLTALGCPRDVAEAIIGHIQPGVEGVYNLHGYDKERFEWLSKLNDYYEALIADA